MTMGKPTFALRPTSLKPLKKPVFGFDIETYNKNKSFYCASLYGDNFQKTFFSKRDIIDFIKSHSKLFRSSIIAATNLSFDFMGTFYNEPEIKKVSWLWRNSDLIIASLYFHNGDFISRKERKRLGIRHSHKVSFIDTFNYAALSVEKQGQILGIPKLEKPSCLGRLPKDDIERDYLLRYNMRDSEISQKFIKFLYKSFHDLGATPKLTLASTSMSLFKNKYLKETYYRHSINDLIEQFKGYYGGRCEAIGRGYIEGYEYYDFNSLYPFCMTKIFPHPNTLRTTRKPQMSYIRDYEGLSEVTVEAPYMDYPLLPYRHDNKLLFPTGEFRATYTNLELRKALDLGYSIKTIHKIHYFNKECEPFRDFVNDLYRKRKEFKELGNPMEYVVKICMNSLYGKFGQKFQDRDNWIPIPETLEDMDKLIHYERVGQFLRIKKGTEEPKAYCIPAFASYVTAYARLHLYDSIIKTKPIYYDTDSLFTKIKLEESSSLGALKREYGIREGIVVKPKFYGFIDTSGNERIVLKGFHKLQTFDKFLSILHKPKAKMIKFVRFKESQRRNLLPNELLEIEKNFTLEDTKRVWPELFNLELFQSSKPRYIT